MFTQRFHVERSGNRVDGPKTEITSGSTGAFHTHRTSWYREVVGTGKWYGFHHTLTVHTQSHYPSYEAMHVTAISPDRNPAHAESVHMWERRYDR